MFLMFMMGNHQSHRCPIITDDGTNKKGYIIVDPGNKIRIRGKQINHV